jgi:putative MATE family efflux protein
MKKIFIFSVPLMISNILQVLFQMADIAVIGHFGGSLSLGAVGSTATLVTLFTDFLIGASGGINVLTALYLGAKDQKGVERTVHTAAIISVGIGLFCLLSGSGTARFVLQILNTRPELMDGAVLYIRIYFLGMPALAMCNFGNAVFSAGGDTKKPLWYLMIAGVINVILNLFFVIVCKMDVAGVAAASAISQYISAFLIMRALFKSRESYGMRLRSLRLDPKSSRDILGIGIPAGIQHAIFQVANLFIQMGVNSFSATVVAGNSAATNADGLVYGIMIAFYTACGSFMGQNYGAGKKDRIRKSYFISLAYSFGVGTLLGVSLAVFGRQFLSLFTGDSAVIDAGMNRLVIMGLSYGFSAFMDCTIAASRALGKSLIPTIIVIMGSVVFRVIWVYTIFAYFQTIPSLYLVYIFSWGITATAEILYFAHVYRQKMAA